MPSKKVYQHGRGPGDQDPEDERPALPPPGPDPADRRIRPRVPIPGRVVNTFPDYLQRIEVDTEVSITLIFSLEPLIPFVF